MSVVYNIKVNKVNWIKAYLSLWSTSLDLTGAEFNFIEELLTEYFSIKETVQTDAQAFELLFSTKTRSKIRNKLDISVSLFNNRISNLKSKGVILQVENSLILNKKIVPTTELSFKFIVENGQG